MVQVGRIFPRIFGCIAEGRIEGGLYTFSIIIFMVS